MPTDKDVTIRKRQQIDSSKKTMFVFVAGASFIIGVALVVAVFLVQQIIFHTKILAEKQNTISTLENNIGQVDGLKDNLRVLETDSALLSARFKEDSSALQVILDALPDNNNADALGASLQKKFVGAVDGLRLESLVVGASSEQSEEATLADGESGIPFTMVVRGSAKNLKQLLLRFEKSIRIIELTSVEIQANTDGLTLKIQGIAPYQQAQVVELEKKVVKP
ncbi:hypothetical protein CR969_02295 [Candidatus Saccharibacteria bacterium]|nr:MAG: hypothetical protein CR969_02295 [Candidatus Saccharibacteria bacterium]